MKVGEIWFNKILKQYGEITAIEESPIIKGYDNYVIDICYEDDGISPIFDRHMVFDRKEFLEIHVKKERI